MDIQCDNCDNQRPGRFWKAERALPQYQPASNDPIALGVYCSLECARRAAVGSLDAIKERLNFILDIEGHSVWTRVWQRLVDAYPEPVPVLNEDEVSFVYE